MTSKLIIISLGVAGSLLIVYGGIAHSLAGLVGLFVTGAAIIAAGFIRRTSPPDRDEIGAKASVLASVLGQ